MYSDKKNNTSADVSAREWIQSLNDVLRFTDGNPKPGLRTTLSCRNVNHQPSLFVAAELAELQPDVLQYLHAFAARHSITLIEDRRQVDVRPISERRAEKPGELAMGISLLLKQTGLPGPARCLSTPHMLRPDNPQIDLGRLIRMAAAVHDQSKKVVFMPNRFLTGDFSSSNEPMTGYACNVITGEQRQVLSYFTAPEFHALGYISNDQFVLHVLLAGGSVRAPVLWSPLPVMTDTNLRCQVFNSRLPEHNFGVLYTSFFIDLDHSMEDQDWWDGVRTSNMDNNGR